MMRVRSTKRLTTEEFVKRARQVHRDKYDYSRVKYTTSKSKIEIICPEHGNFWQIPNDHLRGKQCSSCSIIRRSKKHTLTTGTFIERARRIHGDKYDYSRAKYVKMREKIEITCPEHGAFWQKAGGHLMGYGCMDCAGKRQLSTQDFIKRAREIHTGKYDYSKVSYRNSKEPVEIVCPQHGSFWQNLDQHIGNGNGCRDCAIERQFLNPPRRLDIDEFVEKSKDAHGDKYDYSKSKYVNSKIEAEIICPEHGSFLQTPISHWSGHGCPLCRASRGEQRIADTLREWGVNFVPQKRFRKCRDKGELPFDFYFRIGKLPFLVEYDGIQHFEPVDHWGGEQSLLSNQKKDAIRNRFAQDNGFILIRIPYWEYDNLEVILKEELEKHTGKPLARLIEQKKVPRDRIKPVKGRQLGMFE